MGSSVFKLLFYGQMTFFGIYLIFSIIYGLLTGILFYIIFPLIILVGEVLFLIIYNYALKKEENTASE